MPTATMQEECAQKVMDTFDLTGRQYQALLFYFGHELTQSEIADRFGITQQGASELVSRARRRLAAAGHSLPLRGRTSRKEIREIFPSAI